MGLDLINNFDRYEKKITSYLLEGKSKYFSSNCYNSLANRADNLTRSNDMMFGGTGSDRRRNTFASKVAFPIVKVRANMRTAILGDIYRKVPIISILPRGNTSLENAKNAQEVVNMNLRSTKYKTLTLRRTWSDLGKFGVSVQYSQFQETFSPIRNTVNTDFGTQSIETVDKKSNVWNHRINFLNYFQDPDVPEPSFSTYQGHVDRTNLAKLKAEIMANPDSYIKDNVRKIINNAEKSSISDSDYSSANRYAKEDPSRFNIDKTIVYAQIFIPGNEDDLNWYRCEIVQGKIIRIQKNPHNRGIRPYGIFRYYERDNYWWGNADSEMVMPHENFFNALMKMKADAALRHLDQFILYGKGTIDPADWNNRHVNGGLVGVEMGAQTDLSRLLYQFQPRDNSLAETDAIAREIKESMQTTNPQPDLLRLPSRGGASNRTATAALVLEEQGDVQESWIIEGSQSGLQDVAEYNITLFQQHLGEVFAIRPDPRQPEVEINKADILGDFDYNIATAATKNKAAENLRMTNFLTAVMNFRGTQDPSWMNVNLPALIRNWIDSQDLGDIDEIYPAINETQQQDQQPLLPEANPEGALNAVA